MSRRALRLSAACALLLAAPGCLIVYQKDEHVRALECKRAVTYESPAAAQAFNSAVAQRRTQQEALYSKTLNVPFLCSITKTGKLSEAAFFNDQVVICDVDHNGVITAAEAEAYQRSFTPAHVSNDFNDDTGVLLQSGVIECHPADEAQEVYYPRPYASPPELRFMPDTGHKQLEQYPQGFRARFGGCMGAIHWEARGVPAPPGTTLPSLGAPLAAPPMPVSPAAATFANP